MSNDEGTIQHRYGKSRAYVRILGIRIDDVTFAETMREIEAFVQHRGPHQIVTVNTEYLVAAHRDPEFARVLHRAALNVPDSIGVLIAARWLGHPLRERVTGSDGLYHIAEFCAQKGYRLFLLGAAPGVADQVGQLLTARYPDLRICGTFSGDPSPEHEAEIAERVRQARTDILLVAFGAKQEKWIARNLAKSGAAVGVGVGGAFDFAAGVQKRAPLWMQQAGLEWLHRLVQQPWRWQRMKALPTMMWLVVRQRWEQIS